MNHDDACAAERQRWDSDPYVGGWTKLDVYYDPEKSCYGVMAYFSFKPTEDEPPFVAFADLVELGSQFEDRLHITLESARTQLLEAAVGLDVLETPA